MKKFIKISLLVLTVLISSVSITYAQGFGLSLTPVTLELELSPGESHLEEVTLKNLNSENAISKVSIEDFIYNSDGELEFINPEELEDPALAKFSLKKWINTKDSFILQGSSDNIIPIEINVPEDAQPGGHYGIIFFDRTPLENNSSSSNIGISGKIGLMVIINIPGETSGENSIKTDLQTGDLDENGNFEPRKTFFGDEFLKNGPVNFAFEFMNGTGTHVIPKGTIEIRNTFNKLTDTIAITESRVFPGSSREIKTEWDKKLLIGKYKAILNITDEDGKTYTSETTFWGIPKYITLGIFGGLLGLVFLIAIYTIIIIKVVSKKKA